MVSEVRSAKPTERASNRSSARPPRTASSRMPAASTIDADPAVAAEPLAEPDRGQDRRHQRRRAARDRIDLPEVAEPVGLRQREIVDDVDRHRRQHVGPGRGARQADEDRERHRDHAGRGGHQRGGDDRLDVRASAARSSRRGRRQPPARPGRRRGPWRAAVAGWRDTRLPEGEEVGGQLSTAAAAAQYLRDAAAPDSLCAGARRADRDCDEIVESRALVPSGHALPSTACLALTAWMRTGFSAAPARASLRALQCGLTPSPPLPLIW